MKKNIISGLVVLFGTVLFYNFYFFIGALFALGGYFVLFMPSAAFDDNISDEEKEAMRKGAKKIAVKNVLKLFAVAIVYLGVYISRSETEDTINEFEALAEQLETATDTTQLDGIYTSLREVNARLGSNARYEDIEKMKQSREYYKSKFAANAERAKNKMIKAQFTDYGAHIPLMNLILAGMNDPSSFEHVESKYSVCSDHLLVEERFRGKNAFGALVVDKVVAKVSFSGEILEIVK